MDTNGDGKASFGNRGVVERGAACERPTPVPPRPGREERTQTCHIRGVPRMLVQAAVTLYVRIARAKTIRLAVCKTPARARARLHAAQTHTVTEIRLSGLR